MYNLSSFPRNQNQINYNKANQSSPFFDDPVFKIVLNILRGKKEILYEHPTVSLLEFKSKLAGVSLDGRDVRVDGPLGIQWKENVPFAPGLRLGRVDRVLIGTVAAMTLLQSNDGRQIIIFKVLLVIMHNLGSHCAQYVYHLCICVLAGTHARCHSPHWPASCSDRSSRARYASRLQVHRQSFHYTRGETRRRDRGGR